MSNALQKQYAGLSTVVPEKLRLFAGDIGVNNSTCKRAIEDGMRCEPHWYCVYCEEDIKANREAA